MRGAAVAALACLLAAALVGPARGGGQHTWQSTSGTGVAAPPVAGAPLVATPARLHSAGRPLPPPPAHSHGVLARPAQGDVGLPPGCVFWWVKGDC